MVPLRNQHTRITAEKFQYPPPGPEHHDCGIESKGRTQGPLGSREGDALRTRHALPTAQLETVQGAWPWSRTERKGFVGKAARGHRMEPR